MLNKISKIRNNIPIKKRLTVLTVIIGLLIVSFGALLIQNISRADKQINEINEVYLKNLINLSGLIENLYSVLLENHILNDDLLNPNAINASINMDLINAQITNYAQQTTDEVQKVLFDNFTLEFYNYLAVLKDINVLRLNKQYEQANQLKATKEIKAFHKMQSYIKNLIDYNTKAIQKNNLQIKKIQQNSIIKTFIFSAILLLISVISVFLLIKDIHPAIKSIKTNLEILSSGSIPVAKITESENEIGQIAKLFNKLTENLSQLNEFALTLSKGNYSGKYSFTGTGDFIGKALIDLRNSLKQAKEQDEKRKIEDERRNWVNKGHALFSEILRQRAGGITELTDNIIKNLVRYLDANQGGLFLVDDSGKEPKIQLVSAFAYDRKKFFEKEISFGDGLIGTVALERNTIYLKEIPEDYIEIESGLGDANPNSLLIVPLKFEDAILGVVELASFKEFKQHEITFVEELAQSIASTLLTAKINARTEQLLEESEKKSKELAAQEIEMRQNMEEMRATQELAQRREADLRGILSAVDNTLMKGEYNVDGTLLSVNERHLQTMGYELSEIIGKNIEIFIPKEELTEFRKIWSNVVEGNPRQIEVKRKTKAGETIWLINQYTPVQDEKGEISKVLYLAHDITKYKQSEEEAKRQAEELVTKETELKENIRQLELVKENISKKNFEITGILNALNADMLVLEYDLNGAIINVNQNFIELFHKTKDEMLGLKLHECLNIERSEQEDVDLWNKLKLGQAQKIQTKYIISNEESIWLNETYSPIFDQNNKVYKVFTIARNITELKQLDEKNSILLQMTKEHTNSLQEKDREMQETIRDLLLQEEQLAASMKEYRDIADSLLLLYPVIEINKNAQISYFNDLFIQMTGYTYGEIDQKDLLQFVSGKNKTILKRIIHSAFNNNKETVNVEILIKGNVLPVKITVIPITDNENNVLKLEMFFIDLSGLNIGTADESEEQIAAKKKELADLQKEIVKMQKEQELIEKMLDKEEEKLYHQWLRQIKKKLK